MYAGDVTGEMPQHSQLGCAQPPQHRRLDHDDDRTVRRLLTRRACHRLRSGHRVPHGCGHAALVGEIDVGEPAAGDGHDVLGLWEGPGQAWPVHLDDEHLLFDMEREAAAIAYLAKSAGVKTSGDVLDSKLSVTQFPVCGEGHQGTIPPGSLPGGPD